MFYAIVVLGLVCIGFIYAIPAVRVKDRVFWVDMAAFKAVASGRMPRSASWSHFSSLATSFFTEAGGHDGDKESETPATEKA